MSTHRIAPASAPLRAAVLRSAADLSTDEIRRAASPDVRDALSDLAVATTEVDASGAVSSGNRVAAFATLVALDAGGGERRLAAHASWTWHAPGGDPVVELDRIVEATP
jgi:hypothetical protein